MKSGYEHKLVAQGAIGNRTSYQIEDLNDGTRYGVTVTASDGTLYYQDSDEGVIDYVATGISNIQGQEIMMAVYDNRIILSGLDLNTKIECFDLAGHLIKSTLADRDRMELDIQHGSGIYLLRLSNFGISKNYKVIIK